MMKKLLYGMMIAAAVWAAGCSDKELLDPASDAPVIPVYQVVLDSAVLDSNAKTITLDWSLPGVDITDDSVLYYAVYRGQSADDVGILDSVWRMWEISGNAVVTVGTNRNNRVITTDSGTVTLTVSDTFTYYIIDDDAPDNSYEHDLIATPLIMAETAPISNIDSWDTVVVSVDTFIMVDKDTIYIVEIDTFIYVDSLVYVDTAWVESILVYVKLPVPRDSTVLVSRDTTLEVDSIFAHAPDTTFSTTEFPYVIHVNPLLEFSDYDINYDPDAAIPLPLFDITYYYQIALINMNGYEGKKSSVVSVELKAVTQDTAALKAAAQDEE